MAYCLNPDCSKPHNPHNNPFCQGCGSDLRQSAITFDFRYRFRITKILGQGGFGRTYLAQDLDDIDKRPCVVKKLIASFAGSAQEKIRELFNREAVKLKELNHPQIPDLYAYFEHNNALYLVQEHIDGQNLREEVERMGRFNQAKLIDFLQQTLPILHYIHNCEPPIIHRDIKPDNIMRRKGDKKLFLIDFGGAKEVLGTPVMGSGTIASSIVGGDTILYTPGYAAIEQIKGRAKPVSDIYSLGATCVRLLTGCLPTLDKEDEIFDEDNEEWHWQEYLERQGVSIQPQLAEIFNRMLERLPKNRHQSAQEILDIFNLTAPKAAPKTPPAQSNPPQVKKTVFSLFPLKSKSTNLSLNSFSFPVITVNNKGNEISRVTKSAHFLTVGLGNGITMDFVSIPAGEFMMGSPESEAERYINENPQHRVKVPAFFMGKYEVTQEQYQAVTGDNPSHFKGTKRPVERVSWNDCIKFCEELSQKLGKTCRLPSEAEWEYACRAGTTTPFHFGATITTDLANFDANSIFGNLYGQTTTDIGIFPPNAFGLYDMHGNVWEWCQDNYVNNYKGASNDSSPRTISSFPFFLWGKTSAADNTRVLRGGSWLALPKYCRAAFRAWANADYVDNSRGFRLILVP
jgi:formylglycine-generating enzyme required for sulfatase activity